MEPADRARQCGVDKDIRRTDLEYELLRHRTCLQLLGSCWMVEMIVRKVERSVTFFVTEEEMAKERFI